MNDEETPPNGWRQTRDFIDEKTATCMGTEGLPPSRRDFMRAGVGTGLTLGALLTQAPAARALTGAIEAPNLRRIDPRAWLLQRASFGYTEPSFAEVEARGWDGWLDWQLDPAAIDDSALDGRLAGFESEVLNAQQMYDHPTLMPWDFSHQARATRILRATYSRRQLYERIVEFWTNHFNIFGESGETHILKIIDDREVIRANALGSFRDLLHASAKSGAMIAYLDNDTNVVGAPNENYAREVMELHTLGVNGPYDEHDIRELARCFTGWSYRFPTEPGIYGKFLFRAYDHDYGPKHVLGLTIPGGGGVIDAETVLDHLAGHPSTIDFVTRKLASWLLGPDLPDSIVEAAKSTWVATDGDIKAIVRTLLSRSLFERAAPWARPKFKQPMHWMISLFRATAVDMPRPEDTVWMIYFAGQAPYLMPTPNGYPDSPAAWGSLLQPRWTLASLFGNGWFWSMDHTALDLGQNLRGTPKAQWAKRLNELLMGGSMSVHDENSLQSYFDQHAQLSIQIVGEAFELSAASPSFLHY